MYKNITLKRLFIIMLSVCVLFATALSVGCAKEEGGNGGEETPPPTVTYVLSAQRKTIDVDEEYQLSVIDLPQGVSVKWSVANDKIASITDSGLVTGVGIGETKVTAKVEDQTLECTIIVKLTLNQVAEIVLPAEVDNVIELGVGDTYTFAPQLIGSDEQATFTLTSASDAVSVDGLTVTANSISENVVVTISCNIAGVAPITVYVNVA